MRMVRRPSSPQLDEKSDNDVEVTWEDQQKINRFSRLHAMFSDLEDELQMRKTEREDLDELSMELELMDDETILYVCILIKATRWAMPMCICRRVRRLSSSSRIPSGPTRSSRACSSKWTIASATWRSSRSRYTRALATISVRAASYTDLER